MDVLRWKLLVACTGVALLAAPALAKRVMPKPVSPIISSGIQYSANGDGRDEYVVAANATDGKELWKVKVFHNHIKFWIEEDVQWVFITDLKLAGTSLLVRDERARCYSVNLKTKATRKTECSGFVKDN
ncbi:MAG TPA: hypothetical protein VNY09_05755 [Candidatus Sulfotelmatobacter sp.]|jgi:hypothetical protein|nr:hypothetical protein [Candidatus Sulfotelmatobacter sp.]